MTIIKRPGFAATTVADTFGVDPAVAQAEREVLGTYGDTVSVFSKAKSLLKFGRNDNVGTSKVTIWNQDGNETYATTNAIDTISSSSASDSMDFVIEGHTVSGTGTSAQFTFVTQTATLNGQNKVVLSTPLARVSRAYDNGTVSTVGDVYIYEDTTISSGVPTTAATIHAKVLAGDNQTYKAATTFSNTDYAFLTGVSFSVDKKQSASVDFTAEIRQVGKVFRPIMRVGLNTAGLGAIFTPFNPYIIVPKNSDIICTAVSSNTGTAVDASMQFYLAEVTS